MKTIKLLIQVVLVFVINKQTQAQQVIHNAEKMDVGKTYSYWRADPAGFNTGNMGENVIWDFSNLQKLSTENSGEVVLPSQTQHSNKFPNATEVRKAQNGRLIFLERKNDSVFMRGIVQNNPSIEITYTKPQLFAVSPIKYGDSYVSTSEYTYSFGNQNFIGGGFFAMYADGYGKLILDGKTYEDVIRVRIEQDNADTIKPFNSIVSSTQVTAYRWYNRYSTLPILSVDSVVVKTQGGTQSNFDILGLKETFGAVGIDELNKNHFSASVHHDKVTVSTEYNTYIKSIEVYDITGRLLSEKHINDEKGKVVVQLPQTAKVGDLYLIKIQTKNNSSTLKLGVI